MSEKKFIIAVSFLLLAIGCVTFLLLSSEKNITFQSEAPAESSTVIKHMRPQKIRIQPNHCPHKSGEINLALITDSRYVTPTGVSILSAIKNKCAESIYNFYIITENITPADEKALLNLKKIAPETVNIIIIPRQEPDLPYENMQRFLQYKVGMHKIYLPEILQNVDKIIYMDSDTLVLKDLLPLFEKDITSVYAAVAKDGIYYRFPKEMSEIGIDKRGFYFNSGVMLYNLRLQRQDKVVDQLVKYVKTHEDFYGDQDVLNIVFGNKLQLMSYRYNCISTFFEEDDLQFLSGYFGEALPEDTFYIYENATIIHYAGDKPWQKNYKPEFLQEFWFRYYNEFLRL